MSQEDDLRRIRELMETNSRAVPTSNFGNKPAESSAGDGRALFTGALSTVDKFKSALVSGGEAIGSAVGSSVESWRRASDIGVAFNNDAIGLRASVGQTRLSVEDWEGAIKRGTTGLTNLGGTMSDSSKVFNKISSDMAGTDAADQLRLMGYTTKEYNEVLALSLSGRRNLDMNDKASREAAVTSAKELAQEMDAVAKLTGKSRQEQMAAMQERQKDARLQAALELELRKGDKDAREKYNLMDVQLQKVGLDKLGAALYTGRGLTPEEASKMAVLGEAGTKLQAAITATKGARTPEEKEAAQRMMDAAQAEVAARTKSTEFLQATANATGKIGDSFGETYIKSRAYSDSVAAVIEEQKRLGKTVNESEAAQILATRVNNEQKGLTAAGEKIAGANTTALVVQAQNRLRDSSVLLYQTFDKINQTFGKSEALAPVLSNLRNVKPGPTGEPEDFARRAARTYGVADLNAAIESGTVLKSMPGILAKAGSEAFKDLKTIGTQVLNVAGIPIQDILGGKKTPPVEVTPPKTEETPPPKESVPVVSREFGSLGSVGKMIEDFGKGTPAMLHGKEGIVTEDQFKGIFGGLQNNMKGELDKVKTGMPDVKALQQMFNQIKIPDAGEISSQVASKIPMPTSTASGSSEAMNDVARGVNELNMRIERLITAVTDGSAKNVRALKTGGNLLGA